jgi:hypothetical protein
MERGRAPKERLLKLPGVSALLRVSHNKTQRLKKVRPAGHSTVIESILVNRKEAKQQRTQRNYGVGSWVVSVRRRWLTSKRRRQRARRDGCEPQPFPPLFEPLASFCGYLIQSVRFTCASPPPPLRNGATPPRTARLGPKPSLRLCVLCLSAPLRLTRSVPISHHLLPAASS